MTYYSKSLHFPVIVLVLFSLVCGSFTFQFQSNGRIRNTNDCVEFLCGSDDEPICGSDGMTYANGCKFATARCHKPSLTAKGQGSCNGGESNDRPVPTSPNFPASPGSPDSCGTFCGAIYDPVCGSDGKTYGNDCELANTQCRNPIVRPIHKGECENAGSSDSLHPGSASGYPESSNGNPGNGNGYPESGNSNGNPGSGNGYPGSGNGNADSGNVYPGSSNGNQDSGDGSGNFKCGSRICPAAEQSVCASDGKSYHNKCEFNQAKCYNKELYIVREGLCEMEINDQGGDPQCQYACEGTFQPICGTDGKTYLNMCDYEKGQCKNKDLKIYKFGPC